MSKRTRLFLLTASAFLVTGIVTAGIASYVLPGLSALGASNDLSYVPRSAQVLASVDVRHLLDSDLGRKLLASKAAPVPPELLAEAGIDIYKDVDSILVAAEQAPGNGPDGAPLLLARGRFDEARIERVATDKGGARDEHLGIRIISTGTISIAFLEQGLIAAGSPQKVRAALETKLNGGESVEGNDEQMRMVRRVDSGDSWFVARFDALQGRNLPTRVAQQLPSITWFAASGTVDSGLAANIHAEARDDQAAKDLQDVVRGLVTLARMQTSHQQGIADVIDSIQLSGEGNTVTVNLSVPAQTIDLLLDQAMKQRIPVFNPAPSLPGRVSPALLNVPAPTRLPSAPAI
jgi:hypothetical protein